MKSKIISTLVMGVIAALVASGAAVGVSAASPSVARMLQQTTVGRTLDSWLGGNYGSSTNVLCNSGGQPAFEDPATCNGEIPNNQPANGQVACGTAVSGVASYEAPATCGLAVASNTPTATGDVLCATSSSAASYETPATCGLTTPATSVFSFSAYCPSTTLSSNEVCGIYKAPRQGTVQNLQVQITTAGVGTGNVTYTVFDRTTSTALLTGTAVCTNANPTLSGSANFATGDQLDIRMNTSACTAGGAPVGNFNVSGILR